MRDGKGPTWEGSGQRQVAGSSAVRVDASGEDNAALVISTTQIHARTASTLLFSTPVVVER